MKKPFGILGGMGPEASIYFCSQLIKLTQVSKDQDHIPFILYNKPEIPDRTNAIFSKGPSPLKAMKAGVEVLEHCGCSFIVIPCNSAHAFLEELKEESQTKFVNMIEETALFLQKNYPHTKKVGLIATSGTLKSQLYDKALETFGIELVKPPQDMQEQIVMKSIYQIKASDQSSTLKKICPLNPVLDFFSQRKASLIIQGCTEVPLLLAQQNSKTTLIDPMTILAQKIISLYGKNTDRH